MPAEARANLWISQADSDLLASLRVYDPGDHRTYCQAIAKQQQTVEKSVKAIRAALHDALIISISTGKGGHDVTKLASALRRPAKPVDPTDIQHRINKLLGRHLLDEIKAISALAPKLPKGGGLHERNTEYPYERMAGDWTAPALPDSFDVNDVQRFAALALRIYQGSRQVVSALRRR